MCPDHGFALSRVLRDRSRDIAPAKAKDPPNECASELSEEEGGKSARKRSRNESGRAASGRENWNITRSLSYESIRLSDAVVADETDKRRLGGGAPGL